MEKTNLLKGFFNVRRFRDGVSRDQWQLKGEDENIEFSCTMLMADAKACKLDRFARAYEAPPLGNSLRKRDMARVNFKINRNTRWFNADGVEVDRPSNQELDGVQYAVRIIYNEVIPPEGASNMAPRGYWARSIQYREVVQAFAPITDEDLDAHDNNHAPLPDSTQAPDTPSTMPTDTDILGEDLPF